MRFSLIAPLTLAAALSTGTALGALQADTPALASAPRSVLGAAAAEEEPLIYCFTNCRKVGPGEFRNCVCSKNTSPRTVWIVSCIVATDGSYLYSHHSVPPGGSLWSWNQTVDQEWSWITHWVIVPPFRLPWDYDVELANSSITMDASGNVIADTAGTLQARHLPGNVPAARVVDMLPVGEPAWSIATDITPQSGGMQMDENWDGNGDDTIDQTVQTSVESGPGTLTFKQNIDQGKDGTLDHSVTLEFRQDEDGTMHLSLEASDGEGNLESAFTATKTMDGDQTVMHTSYDRNGDALADVLEVETTQYDGSSSQSVLTRDFEADGSVDETETRTVDYRGPRDSTMKVTTVDALGAPTFGFVDQMTPLAGGYILDGQEDADGNGVFDKRMTQLSFVGPFAGGIDQDYFGVDSDNNGTYDSMVHVVSVKSLQAGTYSETIGTDAGADGTLDGAVQRTEALVD